MSDDVPLGNLTKMNRRFVYRRERDRPGCNGCIYCNEISEAPLTSEHIIPESLGGTLVIENASCANCADQSDAFEGHACNVLKPIRRQLGLPQKHRGAKQREYSVGIMGIEPQARGEQDDFGRMLAKIAHSYAAAELGCGSFHPSLVHAIRGVKPYCLPYYIGSGISKQPPFSDLHQIEIDASGMGDASLIVVKIRLFANRDTPTHYVVVGQRFVDRGPALSIRTVVSSSVRPE